MSARGRVLVIDDEANIRTLLRVCLEGAGYGVTLAAGGDAGVAQARRAPPDVALVDLRMPGTDGLAVTRALAHDAPSTAVVLMTAYATIDNAVDAMRAGAVDYLPKPFTPPQVLHGVEKVLSQARVQHELTELKRAGGRGVRARFESQSPAMQCCLAVVTRAASTDATVLLLGETGTGKGFLARHIHGLSARRERPFVTFNGAVVAASLVEAELFGHARGAFTGADRARVGEAFAREARNVTLPGEGPAVRALRARYDDYTAAVDRSLATPPGASRTDAYFRALLPRFTQTRATVLRVRHMNQSAMEAADRNARALARRGTAVTVALVAVALAFALWLAWWVPRAIVRPIGALADAARAVGAGDLDVEVVDPGVRELAPLAEAFQKMVTQLRAYRQSSLGELLAAKDLADATVRCLVDPVAVCDARGAVLLTNEAAGRAFGLREGDADALRAADAALPEAFARARDEVLATGLAVAPRSFSEAMRWRDRAGERYFLVRAAPLRDDGDARRVIVVAQDVTRLRRIDDLKSDMVATVSHEFKTPLTSLRMATHLLLEPAAGPLNEAQREIVTTARDDTERLRALVDELLDLVRIESEAGELRRTPIDPRRLLAAAAEAHRAIARDKGVALTVDEGAALPSAHVDVEKLAIVLANLVSNAVRHTPAGGRVALGAAHDGAALRITIRDTGEGVDRDELARLLDPEGGASRVPPSSGWRHGLGLTIAKEIVLQHGGELTAQSAPGAGSTFTVVLPCDEGLHSAAP